jgi:hypothetical protein
MGGETIGPRTTTVAALYIYLADPPRGALAVTCPRSSLRGLELASAK